MSLFDDALASMAEGVAPQEAARRLVDELTPDEKLWCLDGDAPTWAGIGFLGRDGYHHAPFTAARVERVGLPGFAFSDGPRGVVIGNATCFPVSMARGATWDPDLEERVGDAIGRELRAQGATLYGGVCVNLLRHPAWGRAQETYGEDPHHVGELGAALTRGVQRHAMACVKHLACNSIEDARFTVDVTVGDRALHEVYLSQFKRVVDEGVACVMSAYNSVNGDFCGENRALLTEVLRHQWGFRGFVISDWIFGLRDAANSLTAGLDVEMPYRMVRAQHLHDALDDGRVSWDDVDVAVAHVVETLLRFDHVISTPAPGIEVVAGAEHRGLARLVAARGIVLLRNEAVGNAPLLPLSAEAGATMAVIGPLADAVNLGDGGSSDVWALAAVSPLAGLRSLAPGLDIRHDDGADVARAAAVASQADVAVVVVGTTHEDEGEFIGEGAIDALGYLFPGPDDPVLAEEFEESVSDLPEVVVPDHVAARRSLLGFSSGGDRASLRLHEADVALIGAVARANPRTVVVIEAGSAVMCNEWEGRVPAIVHAFYGGVEAGHGLAEVLFGTVNPSGRLPFSVPADEAHLPEFDPAAEHADYDGWHGWWHLERRGHVPAYPFGFGLSYTSFSLEGFAAVVSGGEVVVKGTVANTGPRDGADVVQVYAQLPEHEDRRRLVGFARVPVPTGQGAPVVVRVPTQRLARRTGDGQAWEKVEGAYHFVVARFVGDPSAIPLDVDI